MFYCLNGSRLSVKTLGHSMTLVHDVGWGPLIECYVPEIGECVRMGEFSVWRLRSRRVAIRVEWRGGGVVIVKHRGGWRVDE